MVCGGCDNSETPGCCPTLGAELVPCQDWFYVRDPVTDRILDIPESFAPVSYFALAGKLVMAIVTIGTLVYTLLETDDKAFYFAYLTNATLAVQCVYHVMSVSNSLYASSMDQPEHYVEGRAKWTWLLFNLSMWASIIVALLWWGTVFDYGETSLNYKNLGPHLVTMIIAYIDGFWLNRIPIRFNHWIGTGLPYSIAYSTWTYLHSEVFDIGNPTTSDSDPTTNDDVLYEVVDWKGDLLETAITIGVIIVFVGPLVQLLLVWLSLYHIPCICGKDRRRYLYTGEEERPSSSRKKKQTDEESSDGLEAASWY